MTAIDCFWMTITDQCRRYLRRYSEYDQAGVCSVNGHYHQVWTPIEDGPLALTPEGYIKNQEWDRSDSRWPKSCECGYAFSESDPWQLFIDPIYAADDGREWGLRDAPAGAMWDATWLRHGGAGDWVGPDGISLMVRLPGKRDWCVDGPASSGGGWKRSGAVPNITAEPSILAGDYHGWLRDGRLIPA